MPKRDTGRTVFRLVAVVVVMSALAILGCAGSGEFGDETPAPGPPPVQPSFRDATAADLQNSAFTFSDGAVFNAALLNQGVTLDFGPFKASKTAPFRLQSSGLIASGTATLHPPLTLRLRIIESGLPFTLTQHMRFDAEIDDNEGGLKLTNRQTKTTTTSTPGTASPHPPVLLRATLSGDQAVPPVTTTASGSAVLAFNAEQTRIAFTLEYTGLTAVQQADIHVGGIGDTGDSIFFLCTNLENAPAENTPACPEAAGTVTGALTAAELLSPGIESGITLTTIADAVSALLLGITYVDVHTAAFPEGEIRGQLGRTAVPPPPPPPMVSFKEDILPIFTSTDLGSGVRGCASPGCHSGASPFAGLNLEADQAYENLVEVPSTEMPELHRVKPGDPDNSYLFRKHTGTGISGVRMPFNNPKFFDDNPDLLELERLWIEQGALNN